MTMLEMFKGDDRTLEFAVKDVDGQPLPLTSYEIVFEARRHYWQSPIISKSLGSGISLGGTTGAVTVHLDAIDTDSLVPGILNWRLRITDTSNEVSTVASGRLKVD